MSFIEFFFSLLALGGIGYTIVIGFIRDLAGTIRLRTLAVAFFIADKEIGLRHIYFFFVYGHSSLRRTAFLYGDVVLQDKVIVGYVSLELGFIELALVAGLGHFPI